MGWSTELAFISFSLGFKQYLVLYYIASKKNIVTKEKEKNKLEVGIDGRNKWKRSLVTEILLQLKKRFVYYEKLIVKYRQFRGGPNAQITPG